MKDLGYEALRLRAPEAAAGFLAARDDGTLGDMDVSEVMNMAAPMAADDNIRAAVPKGEDPTDFVFGSVMEAYMGEHLRAVNAFLSEKAKYDSFAMRTSRTNAMAQFSGVGTDGMRRAIFDADNGDVSPMLAVKERFYFG